MRVGGTARGEDLVLHRVEPLWVRKEQASAAAAAAAVMIVVKNRNRWPLTNRTRQVPPEDWRVPAMPSIVGHRRHARPPGATIAGFGGVHPRVDPAIDQQRSITELDDVVLSKTAAVPGRLAVPRCHG